jgi:fluoroacetyl-CoA thioesterase
MDPTLAAGPCHHLDYTVLADKTVPHVFTDSEEFAVIPQVFASAFLVGLIERACIDALVAHLDWPEEQTVGTNIVVSHVGPTPPDLTIRVNVELIEIDRRRLAFTIVAHDGTEEISRDRHERFIIDADAFKASAAAKA